MPCGLRVAVGFGGGFVDLGLDRCTEGVDLFPGEHSVAQQIPFRTENGVALGYAAVSSSVDRYLR